MLVLADMHMDGDLKEAALEFILKHEEVVFESEEWSLYVKERRITQLREYGLCLMNCKKVNSLQKTDVREIPFVKNIMEENKIIRRLERFDYCLAYEIVFDLISNQVMAGNRNTEIQPFVTMYWNIENYSYCWKMKYESIKSPEFNVDLIKSTWRLVLYPKGLLDESNISCTSQVFKLFEYELVFLAEDGSVLVLFPNKCISSISSVLREVVTKTKREEFLSRDTLKIRCRLWRNDGHALPAVTIFARTVLNVIKTNFLWNIENFSALEQRHKVYCDPRSKETNEMVTLSLGVSEEDIIKVHIKSRDKKVKFLNFQSLITDSKGNKIDCGKREICLLDINKDATYSLPFTIKYVMDNKQLYLKNDVLPLYCECSTCNGFLFSRIEETYTGITPLFIQKPCVTNAFAEQLDSMSDLKEDFGRLYAEGLHSDVKLRTATETFHTHKNILSIRSPVFRKMFETNMNEKLQGCVDVPDLDDDTGRRMLLYLYTNDLSSLQWESALKLYPVADK
ncbi:hypothetical protein NPIL_320311 [Nephila pilipes]|uniref:Uncharacterized protein n=1 Tax=Nephila pilipes TaxID=299642 RepID=A0A8X6T362_NEPPI|nr:hypothetical protein NPIL_320311 [Nephila pilipes]